MQNRLLKLSPDIYTHIYKFLYNNVLLQLKHKLNGIVNNDIFFNSNKLEKTLSDNCYKNKIRIFLNNTIVFHSGWWINIRSFQNHHIYTGITQMEYTDFTIFDNDLDERQNNIPIYEEIKGDCWQDIYDTAIHLINQTDDSDKCNIDRFTFIDEKTIRLHTSYI